MTEFSEHWCQRIPNWMSLTRIGLVPLLLVLAFLGKPTLFLMVFGISLLSDFLDGYLARRFNAQSEWGARLDSWGDALTWIAFTCGAFSLWPDLLVSIGPWVGAALLSFLIPGLYGLVKYRRLPGFHTLSAKAAMAAMGVSVLLLFSDITALPFYASVWLLGIVCLEETLMVHWLTEPREDLHSATAAWRLRKRPPEGERSDHGG